MPSNHDGHNRTLVQCSKPAFILSGPGMERAAIKANAASAPGNDSAAYATSGLAVNDQFPFARTDFDAVTDVVLAAVPALKRAQRAIVHPYDDFIA